MRKMKEAWRRLIFLRQKVKVFYGHLDNVCCEEIELLTPIYSRNISVKKISMFFLNKHIIKGPSLKSDINISFVSVNLLLCFNVPISKFC